MTSPTEHRPPEAQAEERVRDILKAAQGWAREAPAALAPAVQAVCIRLGEMVADQRHYLAPLPGPQEAERSLVLVQVAQRLASAAVAQGVATQLTALTDLELKATASWSLVPSAQAEWIATAVRYLESCTAALPEEDRPDAYWAEDVVAGVIASVRAVIGVDELHARTEAQYPGQGRRGSGDYEEEGEG